jgi:hypothetical protein
MNQRIVKYERERGRGVDTIAFTAYSIFLGGEFSAWRGIVYSFFVKFTFQGSLFCSLSGYVTLLPPGAGGKFHWGFGKSSTGDLAKVPLGIWHVFTF